MKISNFLVILLASISAMTAHAEDWSGQTASPGVPFQNGFPDYYSNVALPGYISTYQIIPTCISNNGFSHSAPPCAPNETTGYDFINEQHLQSIPQGATAQPSDVGFVVNGAFLDPTSPSGVSWMNTNMPLSAFARSDTVGSLGTQVAGLGNSLTTLQDAVSAVQSQLGTLPTAMDVAALQSSVTSQGASIGTLQSTVSTHSSSIASLQGSALSQGTAIGQLQTDLASVQGDLSALTISVSSFNTQLASIDTSLSDLDHRVAALESIPAALVDIGERIDDARQSADEGTAMAAAITAMGPASGKSNRLGINSAVFNDTTAVSMNYAHVSGSVDFNLGVAIAGDSKMARAGVGFSW